MERIRSDHDQKEPKDYRKKQELEDQAIEESAKEVQQEQERDSFSVHVYDLSLLRKSRLEKELQQNRDKSLEDVEVVRELD